MLNYLLNLIFKNNQRDELTDVQKQVLENINDYTMEENPKQCNEYRFNKTKGFFTHITQCKDCKATDEWYSQTPVDPCRYCGGEVQDKRLSGIYINGSWYTKKQGNNK